MSEPQLARLPSDDRFNPVDDCRDQYEDDHSGLAAWTDDDGRFFAVGGDGVAREYGEGDDQRLRDDMARAPRFPRPVTLHGRAFGSEPATAQLDRTVRRLRVRDELLLTDIVREDNGAPLFRALTLVIATGLTCWLALGVLLAWIAGRL